MSWNGLSAHRLQYLKNRNKKSFFFLLLDTGAGDLHVVHRWIKLDFELCDQNILLGRRILVKYSSNSEELFFCPVVWITRSDKDYPWMYLPDLYSIEACLNEIYKNKCNKTVIKVKLFIFFCTYFQCIWSAWW